MPESEKGGVPERSMSTGEAGRAEIGQLIADLYSDDGMKRVRARHFLVALGSEAVAPLIKALSDRNQWVRWEAAKALQQIGDESATQELIRTLEDKTFDLRWLAAEGLISIGRKAVIPLLTQLLDNSDSIRLREGAHHVFHDLEDKDLQEILAPVLSALEDTDATVEVPLAAKAALDKLSGMR